MSKYQHIEVRNRSKCILLILVLYPTLVLCQFSNKLIPYRIENLWGFSNENGKIEIKPKYDSVRFFVCDMAVVGNNGKFGFIDKHGNEAIKLKYKKAKDFNCLNDWAEVVSSNNGKRKINKLGKRVRPKTILSSRIHTKRQISPIYSYDLYIYENEGKYGFIRYTCKDPRIDSCKIYLPVEFDDFKGFGDYLIVANKDGKWGVLNMKREVIQPFEFDEILINKNNAYNIHGFIIIKKGGKFGFMNSKGEIVIEPKYDKAEFFVEELARVWIENRWGYVSKKGKEYFEY